MGDHIIVIVIKIDIIGDLCNMYGDPCNVCGDLCNVYGDPCNVYGPCSNVHDLSSYYDSLQTERELLIDELPVQKQKELNVGIFSPFTSKRCRLDVREEAGVYELHVQYDE